MKKNIIAGLVLAVGLLGAITLRQCGAKAVTAATEIRTPVRTSTPEHHAATLAIPAVFAEKKNEPIIPIPERRAVEAGKSVADNAVADIELPGDAETKETDAGSPTTIAAADAETQPSAPAVEMGRSPDPTKDAEAAIAKLDDLLAKDFRIANPESGANSGATSVATKTTGTTTIGSDMPVPSFTDPPIDTRGTVAVLEETPEPAAAAAAPTHRPELVISGIPRADTSRISLGLKGEHVLDRAMGSRDFSATGGTVTRSGTIEYRLRALTRVMLEAKFEISENLKVFLELGGTGGGDFSGSNSGNFADLGTTPRSYGSYLAISDKTGKLAPAVGLGFELCFPVRDDFAFGLDARLLLQEVGFSEKRTTRFFDAADALLPLKSEDSSSDSAGSATLTEWHMSPFISKDFGNFTLFSGFRYSALRFEKSDENLVLDFGNNWGVFAGTRIRIGDALTLGIEAHFIDETALTLSATYRF
ncbi:MAG: hypothetical protein WCL50_03860 [Spirochaetota bacterium]